jgi:hypothetical protein
MSSPRLPRTLLATSGLFLVACGPAIRTARDEAIPIPQGATWVWGPRAGAPRAPGRPAADPEAADVRAPRAVAVPGDEIVLQRFRRAVGAAMQAKGFREVETPADAEFLLTAEFSAFGAQGPRGRTTIGIGIGGMWGGRGRRGWFEPWGRGPWGGGWMYVPWGWSWFGPMGWGQIPMGGPGLPMGYRESALVVTLRQRSTRLVAWRGQVATDGMAVGHLTQERMNALVAKLFQKLP